MDRHGALRALESDDNDARLKAARFMALNAKASDVEYLQEVIRREPIRWVRTALERAVARGATYTVAAPSYLGAPAEPSDDVVRDIKAEAIEEVAGTLIHEFSPVVGMLRARAKREIDGFEQSETKKLLDMLAALMRGVRELKSAAAVPHFQELELAELVAEAVTVLDGPDQDLVQSAGQSPFIVTVDRSQLLIALTNGIRNAVDAARSNEEIRPPVIVVNWGRAGAEDWLAIIDSGAGFPGNPAAAMKVGVTTKADHIGFGLATASQAMRTMEGDVYLSNGNDGGARFEIRWFRADEDTIR